MGCPEASGPGRSSRGVSGVASIVNLQLVYARLVSLPIEPVPDFSHYPFITALYTLLMSAAVAEFMEEAGFRGYAQVPIEHQYPLWTASFGEWLRSVLTRELLQNRVALQQIWK